MAKAKNKYTSTYDPKRVGVLPRDKSRMSYDADPSPYTYETYPVKAPAWVKDEETTMLWDAPMPLRFNPFIDNMIDMEFVGSRVTCNPPPKDTDEDILIYTETIATLIHDCKANGFVGGEVYFTPDSKTTSQFISLKQGDINLIVTDNKDFYDKFLLATHVCKTLNVMEKQHRITVFQAILYGKKIEG